MSVEGRADEQHQRTGVDSRRSSRVLLIVSEFPQVFVANIRSPRPSCQRPWAWEASCPSSTVH